MDIEQGKLVREGESVEFYDWDSGSYKDLDIESISTYGSSTEIEGTDSDGNDRTFDMDE